MLTLTAASMTIQKPIKQLDVSCAAAMSLDSAPTRAISSWRENESNQCDRISVALNSF